MHAETDDSANYQISVLFSRPVATLFDIQLLPLEVIARAREALGITALTSPERQAQQMDAIRTYITSVVKVERLTPIFKRITFGGGDLA